MTPVQIALVVWLGLMNLAAFVAMGVDKSRAKRDAWRIRERTLFLLALFGGSVGAIAGMRIFHHKTRHWYFVVGLPAILVLQIGVAAAVWDLLIQGL